MTFVSASFSFTILDSFWVTLGGAMLLKCSKSQSELMSPFLVQLSFFYDFGFTFEPRSEAYRHFSASLVNVSF